MKFQKKPVVVEAIQWFKKGDHPEVLPSVKSPSGALYQHDKIYPDGGAGYVHTFSVFTSSGLREVSPGDWIVDEPAGGQFLCKPDAFASIYELVDENAITGNELEPTP